MHIWDEMGNFLKTMRVYLLGRGFLSLTVFGASIVAPGSFVIPALIACGGLALSAMRRTYTQMLYEDQMADLYREDIAQHLGIAPQEVTRTHLKIAAQENEVIGQAIARQRRISIVSFFTSAIAAATTFGLIYFALAPEWIGEKLAGFFDVQSFGKMADFLRYASVGIVSGMSSLILHDGLEAAIGKGSGLNLAAAHDLIARMDRDVHRGRTISAEQVYGVLVAKDKQLDAAIRTQFHESFHAMNPTEQRRVLTTLGIAEEMDKVAGMITKGELPAGHLAYMIEDALRTYRPRETAATTAPVRGQFVERLGLAPRADVSHVERVNASRQATPEMARA